MTARIRYLIVGVALAAGLPAAAGAQQKSVSEPFRRMMNRVAAASRLPRLDSAALPPGVTREIRVYKPFRSPSRVIRLWEDSAGAHGSFGIYWRRTEPTVRPDADSSELALSRRVDTRVREFADSVYHCNDFMQDEIVEVCWLPRDSTDDWPGLLARLDLASIGSIPDLAPPDTASFPTIFYRDGWGIVVEVRTSGLYRAFQYVMPERRSPRTDVRAAATVLEIFDSVWRRRVDR